MTDARAAIEACAVWNARLAARRLTQFLTDHMKASELSVAQFGLMAQIAAAADDSLGALAERSGLDPSTLSRNLQVLEREGLVEMAAGETDSRRRAVWLSEDGARRLETALAEWRKAHAELAALIDVGAVQRIAKATERLAEV
ncbi:MAG TPA: MarR family winged helix-turn-helix transcriptional regulator [Roseiarcus sp.]|nr:MarR family winged helix-turn-helix transcriptional regulator [Roseiarcus sp.]